MCVNNWVLPQQHVARVAGGDPFKGVHVELVEVVCGVLWANVGSKQDITHNKH